MTRSLPTLLDDIGHVTAILDTVGEGIVTINTDETILMMNAEADHLWGIERGEYLGKHVHTLMPERYRSPHSDAFRRHANRAVRPSGRQEHVEVQGLRKDGREFPLELRFTSVQVDGRWLYIAAARDITERVRRLEELQQRIRAEDVLTRISSGFINAPVECIGRSIDLALAELGELAAVDRAFLVIIPKLVRPKGPEDTTTEKLLMPTTMAREWCAAGVKPFLTQSEGHPFFHSGADPAEVQAHTWFKSQLLRDSLIRVDSLDDVPAELEIVRVRLMQWHVQSRLAIPIRAEGVSAGVLGVDMVHRARRWDSDTEQLLQQAGSVFAAAVLRKRGAEALQRAHADLERKVADRTRELRENQAHLIQTEKLASLGQLVAGVAHEVNTPLGAIKSNNDTAMRALGRLRRLFDAEERPQPGEDSLQIQRLTNSLEHMGRVSEDAIERIATLVRSLRSFARLDQAEEATADLNEGLRSTLTLLHHELRSRVQVECDFGELPPVRCHPNQLNQVFMNLLNNASQAIEASGTIRIQTRHVAPDIVISVQDTGRGIRPENVQRVFDPGFTTKGVGVGTGLGLSIVHQIVERHRGRIEIASVVGEGTTVTLRLPVPG